MNYVFITNDLTPNYNIQDELYDLKADKVHSFVVEIISDLLLEFNQALKNIIGQSCSIHWLLTKNESIHNIDLSMTSMNKVDIRKLVDLHLKDINLNNDCIDGGGLIKMAFTSPTNNIWDYDMIELSRTVGPTSSKNFYLFGYHPQHGDTIVTQGYCDGDFDTGILIDHDVSIYGAKDIIRMIPFVTEEMFLEAFYK